MKKTILTILSILFSIIITHAQETEQVKLLEANDFKKEITKDNSILIDVRTAEEYDSGHINNAVNVDFYNQNAFIEYFKKIDKEKSVFLYCRSGGRSNEASKILIDLGFIKNIYDLKGGYLNWVKE